jgi:hypothetical protein
MAITLDSIPLVGRPVGKKMIIACDGKSDPVIRQRVWTRTNVVQGHGRTAMQAQIIPMMQLAQTRLSPISHAWCVP